MKALKVNITPTSSFSSLMHSDSWFGNFCWGVYYIYSKARLEELLSDYSNNPFIIFSNSFYSGTLPKPYLEPVEFPIDEFEQAKQIKKSSSLSKEGLLELIKKQLNGKELLQYLIHLEKGKKEDSKKTESISFLKSSINRDSGTSKNGLMYSSKETFYDKSVSFDLYIKYSDKITFSEIKDIFSFIGVRGFGKDKNTGKGHFNFTIDELLEDNFLKPKEGVNSFISLSNGLLLDDPNCSLLYGKTFTKFPKLGGDYAMSGKYLKNPIVLLEPGSTFEIKDKPQEYYGNSTQEVFSNPQEPSMFQNHFHSGYMIPLFFKREN